MFLDNLKIRTRSSVEQITQNRTFMTDVTIQDDDIIAIIVR